MKVSQFHFSSSKVYFLQAYFFRQITADLTWAFNLAFVEYVCNSTNAKQIGHVKSTSFCHS